MYDIVRGPLVWISVLVFLFGTAFQVYRFYRLSRLRNTPTFKPKAPPPGQPPEAGPLPTGTWRYRLQMLRLTVIGSQPVMVAVTTLFHVCLVITPFFVLGHNILLDLAWGVSFPSLPEAVTDALTLVVVLGGAYFLYRRMFVDRVRAISTPYDYIVLVIATLPFLSGFLAYHRIFDYDTVIFIHMLAGEVMLIAIPFTKLVHMPFFFINRFVVIHENTFGRGGSRVWR
jgi:nitrate reductase gamma subunit